MASGGGYGGQSFGGWGGSSYGGSPFGARPTSFGGTRYQGYNPTAFGKASYEPSPVPTQAPYGSSLHEPYRDPGANGVARGGMPFNPNQNWLPGGGAFIPQGQPPVATDPNWYERGQGGTPTQQPAPTPDNNWYERGQGMPPSFGGAPMPVNRMAPPMQEAPQQPAQPAQRQAPAGYYYDQNGRMLAGTDPAQFNKGTNIYGGSPAGQYGGAGYVPGSGWQQMLDIYARELEANMAQAAPFGRYQDGSPMTDPSRNVRADYRLQNPAYAGGWPGYTPRG